MKFFDNVSLPFNGVANSDVVLIETSSLPLRISVTADIYLPKDRFMKFTLEWADLPEFTDLKGFMVLANFTYWEGDMIFPNGVILFEDEIEVIPEKYYRLKITDDCDLTYGRITAEQIEI